MSDLRIVWIKNNDGNIIEMAEIDGGEYKNRTLSGFLKLNDNNPVSYSSGKLDLKLTRLNLLLNIDNIDWIVDKAKDLPEINILDGEGSLEVSRIGNLNGTIYGDFTFADSIEFKIRNEMNFGGYGFKFDKLKLEGVLTKDLDLKRLKGEMSARHDQFDSELQVTDFLIEDSQLKSLTMKGHAKIKGANLLVKNAELSERNLELEACLKIQTAAGQKESEMAEINLKNFIVDQNGKISEVEVAGSLSTELLDFDIEGKYSSRSFALNFSSQIAKNAEITGKVDLGSTESYNYLYLYGKMKSNVGGIPLGPTGILINSLDAGFGFNYYMDYLNIENSTHKHLSYTVSLGLGIAG
jgi:hypothetical protein